MSSIVILYKRQPVVLPRVRDGADYDVPQLLLATEIATGRRLYWWPGHAAWSGRGSRSWYQGVLCVDEPGRRTMPVAQYEHHCKGMTLARVLQSPEAEGFVREHFMSEPVVWHSLGARRTIEVRVEGPRP